MEAGDAITALGAIPVNDCTTAVEERLNASLALDRLRSEIEIGYFPVGTQTRDDVVTLLDEVTRLKAEIVHLRLVTRQALGAVGAAKDKLASLA